MLKGKGYHRCFVGGEEHDERLYVMMKSYRTRKYDGMTAGEADAVLEEVEYGHISPGWCSYVVLDRR